MRDELGIFDRERADGELENLISLGGPLGLDIRYLLRIDGEDFLPRGGVIAGFLHRHRHIIGIEYKGFDFCQSFCEVGLCDLLDGPLEAEEAALVGGLKSIRAEGDFVSHRGKNGTKI